MKSRAQVHLCAFNLPLITVSIILLISLNTFAVVSAFPNPNLKSSQESDNEQAAMIEAPEMEMETTTAAPMMDELLGIESRIELDQFMIQTTETPTNADEEAVTMNSVSSSDNMENEKQAKYTSRIQYFNYNGETGGITPVEMVDPDQANVKIETVTHLNSTALASRPQENFHSKRQYDEEGMQLKNPESYDEDSNNENDGAPYGLLDNASVSQNEPGNGNGNSNSGRDSSEGKLGGGDLGFRSLDIDTEAPATETSSAAVQDHDQNQSDSAQAEPEPEPEPEADVQGEYASSAITEIPSMETQNNLNSSMETQMNNSYLPIEMENPSNNVEAPPNSSADSISLTLTPPAQSSQEDYMPTPPVMQMQKDGMEKDNLAKPALSSQEDIANTHAPAQSSQEENLNGPAQSSPEKKTHAQSNEYDIPISEDTTQTLSEDTNINAINPRAINTETQSLNPVEEEDSGNGQTAAPALAQEQHQQGNNPMRDENMAAHAQEDMTQKSTMAGPDPVPMATQPPSNAPTIILEDASETSTSNTVLLIQSAEAETTPLALMPAVAEKPEETETKEMETMETTENLTLAPKSTLSPIPFNTTNSDSDLAENKRMERNDADSSTPMPVIFVNHGSTYYFRNVADNSSLTCHRHKFSRTQVIPGKLTSEEFAREDNQLWDVATIKGGQDEDTEYWMMSHKYPLNTFSSYLTAQTESTFPNKNIIKLIRAGSCNKIFLIHSVPLNKCLHNEGMHQDVTYSPCDNESLAQQWTAEFLYEMDNLNINE